MLGLVITIAFVVVSRLIVASRPPRWVLPVWGIGASWLTLVVVANLAKPEWVQAIGLTVARAVMR